MKKIKLIVDTSVIIKWLSEDNEKYLDQANSILIDLQNGKVEIFAPELAKYEVGNVLLFSKKLTSQQATIVLSEFFNLPISFVKEPKNIAIEAFSLASKLNITYYDASFLALAKENNAILITENIKHQGKTKNIKVIHIKDYSKMFGS